LSTAFRVQLPRRTYLEMLAHVRAALPNEGCGLLAGAIEDSGGRASGRVLRHYPLANDAASPKEYYSAPFAAFKDMRESALELLAIYHSHPTSEPVPSHTDLECNFYGFDVVHYIISLQGAEPVIRGWHLQETESVEAEWDLVDDL
jgi:proteasome lid subunit RPN8/RPN11